MGKTFVYLAVFGILGFGVWYFFIKNSDNLYSEREANFSFSDTGAIGKIYLVETAGESVLLERGKGDQWIVNKTYPAMRMQVINLLTCLKMQTPHSPVPDRDYDRVIKLLAGMGTKVEVYDRAGNKMRAFTVAGQGPDYHGSYMLTEGAQRPYLVEIRGFEGYLTPRYVTDVAEWRSRSVFALPPQEIGSVSVQYPAAIENSYVINNMSTPPSVQLSPKVAGNFPELNQGRVAAYLQLFGNINAEGYMNGLENLDSAIAHSILRAKMSVTDKKGNSTALDIYWIEADDQTENLADQTSTDPQNRPQNVDRMYAVNLSSKDTLLVQRLSFEKLLRAGQEFFQADAPVQQPMRPNINTGGK